jgi:competence protein ComEC
MNWHEYPILRLLVPLLLGILFFLLFSSWAPHWSISIIALMIVAFLAWPKKYLFPYKHRYLSGLLMYIAIFLLGIGLSQFHFAYEQNRYFANHNDSNSVAIVRIVEAPESKPKSIKLIAEVVEVGSIKHHDFSKGLVVLYLQKDSLAQSLKFGDQIILKNKLQLVKTPQNPDEFNYRNYLYNQGVQYQAYLRTNSWKQIGKGSRLNIHALAISMRNYLLSQLQKHNLKNAEFSVAAAMLLGVRNHLSPDLRQAFSGAGAMHILCVSGLHVGIIFMLLSHFLAFLNRLKSGKRIKLIIILSGIWIYALITGFSPSVVRAATMFSFISIGQNIGRQVNIYNSLAASAFVLLVFNPYLILDVGFQLSYAAVIAIVVLQKPIQDIWTPPWKWLFKIWQLITVSIAAQIGTAPLALFYFHSFPNYFLLTNLIVIPAAFIIFITGIATLVFAWAGPFADFLGWILSKMISILNWAITGIQELPFAVSSNIYINATELIILILISIFTSIMLIQKKPKLLLMNLFLIASFIGANIYQHQLPAQFIVYQSGKYDYISFTNQGKEIALTDADVMEYPNLLDYQIREHHIRFHIHNSKLRNLYKTENEYAPNYFRQQQFVGFMNLRMAIITPETVGIEYSGKIPIDYLILSNNPDVSLKQLSETYLEKQIIISPTNAPWKLKKWKNEIAQLETPVWIVKEQGAFVLNIK